MLERKDIERYERNAERILSAIDRSRVPVDWATLDEPELIQVIARELIRIDRKAAGKEKETHDLD